MAELNETQCLAVLAALGLSDHSDCQSEPRQVTFAQWTTLIWDGKVQIYCNFDPKSNKLLFYADVVDLKRSQYGDCLRINDPSLALPIPTGLSYVDTNGNKVDPEERISGVITVDGVRFSLSNRFMQKKELPTISDDGSMEIDGTRYWLCRLLMPDEHRVKHYVAFLDTKRPEHVIVCELGDFPFPH